MHGLALWIIKIDCCTLVMVALNLRQVHSQIVTQLTEFGLTGILEAEFESYKHKCKTILGTFHINLSIWIGFISCVKISYFNKIYKTHHQNLEVVGVITHFTCPDHTFWTIFSSALELKYGSESLQMGNYSNLGPEGTHLSNTITSNPRAKKILVWNK